MHGKLEGDQFSYTDPAIPTPKTPPLEFPSLIKHPSSHQKEKLGILGYTSQTILIGSTPQNASGI